MCVYLKYDAKVKLPTHISVPIFITDSGHRIKVKSSSIFELVKVKKDLCHYKNRRFKNRKIHRLPFILKQELTSTKMIKRTKTPIENVFNCHG